MSVESTARASTDGTVEVSTGVRLGYRDVGDGEPVLLIMGVAGSLGMWAPIEPALTAAHRVISFDNRGLGASERGEGEISVVSMAEDAAALLDALALDRAHVLGWSLGSAVAQELALRHPDRVGSLVLYGTYGRLDGFQRTVLGSLRYPYDRGDLEAAIAASGILFSRRLLNSPEFEALVEELVPLFPQTAEHVRVVSEQWVAAFAHDTLDRLPEVSTPTLVLSGEQDLLTPGWQCDAVADAIPGAEIVSFTGPGSSHALHLERTDEFTSAVTEFLEHNPLAGEQ